MDREKSKPQSKASHSRFKPSIIRSDGYVELELSEPVPVEVKNIPEVINSSVIRSRQQLSKEQFGRSGNSSQSSEQQFSREEPSSAAADEPLNEDSFADLLNSNKLHQLQNQPQLCEAGNSSRNGRLSTALSKLLRTFNQFKVLLVTCLVLGVAVFLLRLYKHFSSNFGRSK
ncbi:hypothetical protein TYRP_017449 [Tyrophagus putrescentiae]|nr:hypothetical protein TYRP_017449 [Tyrophagus putrescentiae]